MKVNLSVSDDKELRDHIKECIHGQVVSITRDEILQTVKDEFKRKAYSLDPSLLQNLISLAARQAITEILYKHYSVTEWNTTFLKPFIEGIVKEKVQNTNWEKLIDDMAKQKIKELIK